MLLSSIIHLQALERGALPQYLAPALRAEFLNWIGEKNKAQSDLLHDGNELRPYTVSDLTGTFRSQNGFNLAEAGQKAWFRVTSLTDKQTRLLREEVFPKIVNQEIKLNNVRCKVLTIAEQHPWVRHTSYIDLVEKYFNQNDSLSDSFMVKFNSLTTFSTGDLQVPLPNPKTVVSSWLTRWNKFSRESGVNLPERLKELKASELKEAKLVLNRYALETTTFQYKPIKWVGFTGKCYYRVLAKDEFWMRTCQLLADFSFYCGTGKNTSFGLGQTRKINELDWKNS